MSQRLLLTLVLFLLAGYPPAYAQRTAKLSRLFRDMYGPNGLVVDSEAVLPDGSTHSGHFNSGFQSEFLQFNVAMVGQLTSLPLPSPASGFTYVFDTSTGTFKRSTQSFGPILAERAETIGKGRISFGLNYQHFSFDSIEGFELSRIPAVFRHDDYQLGGGRVDVVTTQNTINASVGQTTAFLTYGVLDRLDISVAVPVVRSSLSVVSNAVIQRFGTAEDPRIHFFRDPAAPGQYGTQRQFFASGSASGMGDVIVRAKATALKRGPVGLALGVDARAPTGDAEDLLGSGAPGVKPFAALSVLAGHIAPHFNCSYQWNGKSVLAGDVATGRKGDLPNLFLWVAGADVGISERLTLALDVLGQRSFDSPRVVARTFTQAVPNGTVSFPDLAFVRGSFNQFSGAAGIKTNIGGKLLVNFNLLFKLNDAGLRDRATPLIGIEYSF